MVNKQVFTSFLNLQLSAFIQAETFFVYMDIPGTIHCTASFPFPIPFPIHHFGGAVHAGSEQIEQAGSQKVVLLCVSLQNQ